MERTDTSGSDPRVRVIGITDKVRPEDPLPAYAATGADLVAGINEYAAFQVVAWATGGPLAGLTVTASDLVSDHATLAAENIRISRIAYYESTQPSVDQPVGRWPDPLVPVRDPFHDTQTGAAWPTTVPAGENRGAWVDVLVPPGTPPGVYAGAVSVVAGGLDVQVPVRLEVLAFTLPATASLSSGFGATLDKIAKGVTGGGNALGTQRLAAVLCLDNRISLAAPWPLSMVGTSEFEQVFVPVLDGTDGELILRGARLTSIWPRNDVGRGELQSWHLVAGRHGFQGRCAVFDVPACDELEDGQPGTSWPTCRDQHVALAQRDLPEAATVLTARLEYLQQEETADAPGPITFVDGAPGGRILLACLVNEMDPTGGASERDSYDDGFLAKAAGNRLWLYTSGRSKDVPGCLGYQIDAGGAHVRAIAWYCFTQRVSGELYHDVAAQYGPNAWQPGGLWHDGMNGDGTLLYPSTPNPQFTGPPLIMESIRLKLARAGYQDYEYLRFLADSGAADAATVRQLAATLVPSPYAAATLTDADFVKARAQLVDLLRPLLPAVAPTQPLTL